MKKALCSLICILAVAAAFPLFSCDKRIDYFSYVSELRSDIFTGEKDNYCITVYAGMKEKPFAHDGVANDTALTLTVKLITKEKINEAVTVKLSYDGKEYTKTLEYNPVLTTVSADITVEALPQKKLQATLSHGETVETIQLSSLRLDDSANYTQALKAATDKASEFINKNSTGANFKGEICIRLLCEGDKNYYYVGFILNDGLALAYLLDGKTCEIIAEKTT